MISKCFSNARCKAIRRELSKQIIPQEIDHVGTPKSAGETVVEGRMAGWLS